MPYKRRKMTRKASKRSFRKGAKRTAKVNLRGAPMRGGIRL